MSNIDVLNKAQDLINLTITEKLQLVDNINDNLPVLNALQKHELMHQLLGLNESLKIIEELKIRVKD